MTDHDDRLGATQSTGHLNATIQQFAIAIRTDESF